MAGSGAVIETKIGQQRSLLEKALIGAFIVACLLLPVVFQGMGMGWLVRIMSIVGLWVILALGLNIVVGYAGLLDLGYIAFYAMGSYIGVLGGDIFAKLVPGLSPWTYYLMIPVAAGAAAPTGIALGTPVLRLRGDYLAIVTLGFGEIVRIALLNNAFGITGGSAGLPKPGMEIPAPFPLEWLKDNVFFTSGDFSFTVTDNVFWFYIIFALGALSIFVVKRLDDSRLGRSWVAMREDEVAAASSGVNIMGAKLWVFSLGALWGGIAGLTFANYQAFISPESYVFMESIFVVCIVVLGGMGSIPGAIFGAMVIQGVPEVIRGLAIAGVVNLSAEQQSAVSNYRYLVFGLLMVIMMAVRPQGMIPSQRRARELRPATEKIKDEQDQTLYDAQHRTAVPGEEE